MIMMLPGSTYHAHDCHCAKMQSVRPYLLAFRVVRLRDLGDFGLSVSRPPWIRGLRLQGGLQVVKESWCTGVRRRHYRVHQEAQPGSLNIIDRIWVASQRDPEPLP